MEQLKQINETTENSELTQTIKTIKSLAEEGNAKAQCDLGCLYLEGEVIEQNLQLGVELLKKSAEQGFAQAQEYYCRYYLLRIRNYICADNDLTQIAQHKGWG